MAARQQRGDQPKEIKCDQCNQCFPADVDERILVHHIKTDHIVKPSSAEQSNNNKKGKRKYIFECPFCDLKIKGMERLKTHLESTHIKKKYKCNQCEKGYTTQGSLTVHKAKEHEGKRYPCDYCNHQAKEAGALQNHLDAKHNGIVYQCDECPFESSSKNNLRRHKSSMHINIFNTSF